MKHLAFKTGLVLGFLFFVHALVPDSRAWPMIWPALAGAAVVALAARRRLLKDLRGGVAASARAGVIAGALFVGATVLALFLLSQQQFEPVARVLGANGPVTINTGVVLGLAVAGLLGAVLATISGAITYPLVKHRT